MTIGGFTLMDSGYGLSVTEYEAGWSFWYRATTLNSSAMSGTVGKNIETMTSDSSYPNTTTTHCSNKRRGLRLPSSTFNEKECFAHSM